MTLLKPEPLTKTAFAAFGDVIEVADHTPLHINQGFALRFDDLAKIDVSTDGGHAKTSIFIANPRQHPIAINLMERHPLGTQLFYPLQDRPWLVLVCDDPADSNSYRAFRTSGKQGVNYYRNTWHFPLLVFDAESRFIVVDRAGPGNNLVEVEVKPSLQITV
jgi:ureidoglycolate lyase